MGPRGSFGDVCRPSIPAGSILLTRTDQASIFSAYNSILDEALEVPNLEAVALIHDDVEVRPNFEANVRSALATGAGVIGAIGSVGAPSIAWWDGEKRGWVRDATLGELDFGAGVHSVDTVDGMALVISALCAQAVRFDARRYRGFHGYDSDFCFEARKAGFRVIAAPLDLVHHSKAKLGDEIAYRRADLTWQRKWGRTPSWLLALRHLKLAAVAARSGSPH